MTAVLDVPLLLALLFFLFLPITDRRTVMMKLAMMAILATLFAGSVTIATGLSPAPHPQQEIAMRN